MTPFDYVSVILSVVVSLALMGLLNIWYAYTFIPAL